MDVFLVKAENSSTLVSKQKLWAKKAKGNKSKETNIGRGGRLEIHLPSTDRSRTWEDEDDEKEYFKDLIGSLLRLNSRETESCETFCRWQNYSTFLTEIMKVLTDDTQITNYSTFSQRRFLSPQIVNAKQVTTFPKSNPPNQQTNNNFYAPV